MIRGVVQLVGALVGVIALMVVCTIVIGIFREKPPHVHVFDTQIGEIRIGGLSADVKVKLVVSDCYTSAVAVCGGEDNVCGWSEVDGCWFTCCEDPKDCREWAIAECGVLGVQRWWISDGRCNFECE